MSGRIRKALARSQHDADIYRLYRVFDFRQRPRLFSIEGNIERWCRLAPVTYLATLPSR